MTDCNDRFAAAVSQQTLLTANQLDCCKRARELLARHGIDKTLADMSVESGLLTYNGAAGIVRTITDHPPVRMRHAGPEHEAAVKSAPETVRKELEQLAAQLTELGYRRSVADLLLDRPAVPKRSPTTGPLTKIRRAPDAAPRGQTRVRPRPGTGNRRVLILCGALGGGVILLIVAFLVAVRKPAPDPEAETPIARKPPVASSTVAPPPPPSTSSALPPLPATTAVPPPPPPSTSSAQAPPLESEETKKRREDEAEKVFRSGRRRLAQQEFDGALAEFTSLSTRFASTEFYKSRKEEISRLAEAARNKSLVVGAFSSENTREGYEKRRREREEQSRRRLDAAKAALEADRAAEGKRGAAWKSRLDGVYTLRTKSGKLLKGAKILDAKPELLRISYEFEGGGVEETLAWELLDDKSFASLATAVHKPDGAAGWYELARRYIGRRMWKDAQAAFEECVKADASLKPRVPDLTKVIKGEGAFRGASRRTGPDGLSVTYDFSKPEQGDDFSTNGPGEKQVGGAGLELKAAGQGHWSLRELDFQGEVVIEATVSVEKDGWAAIQLFANWEGHGYTVALGEGFELARETAEGRHVIAEDERARLTGEATIRVSAKGGAIKVVVNGAEVLSGNDTARTKGWCGIGAWRGTATYRRLSVQGRVNPVQLDKMLAESEVLVRRTLEAGAVGASAARDAELSLEDAFLMSALDGETAALYQKARGVAARVCREEAGLGDEIEGAVREFGRVLERAPKFHAAMYWRARLLAFVGRLDKATEDLQRCATEGESVEAVVALGELCRSMRQHGQAKQYAEMALQRLPGYAPALALRGYVKFSLGHAKEALEDLDIAVRVDPADDLVRRRRRSVATEIRGPEVLGCKFKAEYPHFLVYTDMSAEKTKFYGERMEAAYTHYKETFREFYTESASRPKPRVAIFNTREAYLTYSEFTLLDRPENALGYYMHDFHELLLFEDPDLDETLHTMYHEGFHQFMATMVPHAPYWYNEGIAEYMGAIKVEKGKVVAKGRILDGRLKVLRAALDQALPFQDIVLQSPGEFYSGPASFKYSQAWTMIHFFYEGAGGRHRGLIDAYFRALVGGKSIGEAFVAAFGKADLTALQAEWRTYVEGLPLPKK